VNTNRRGGADDRRHVDDAVDAPLLQQVGDRGRIGEVGADELEPLVVVGTEQRGVGAHVHHQRRDAAIDQLSRHPCAVHAERACHQNGHRGSP
jgi:hypothetical protein